MVAVLTEETDLTTTQAATVTRLLAEYAPLVVDVLAASDEWFRDRWIGGAL